MTTSVNPVAHGSSSSPGKQVENLMPDMSTTLYLRLTHRLLPPAVDRLRAL